VTGYRVTIRSDDRCEDDYDATVRLDVGTAGVQITDLVVRAGAGAAGGSALDLDVLARAFAGATHSGGVAGSTRRISWPVTRRSPRVRMIHRPALDHS
jgi:hypothetical protein